MTDLPYTYTEPNGDSLRMCSDGPDLVVTVRQDGGARTVVVPREETPNLARAVLAAAGDTGHEVINKTATESAALPGDASTSHCDVTEDLRERVAALTRELEATRRAKAENDVWLQTAAAQARQEADQCRDERDQALQAARSMRERAADSILQWHDALTPVDLAHVVRALPLLPDDTEGVRTMRHCVLCASGDHQPSAHDDAPAPDMWARLKSEIPRIYGRERVEDLPHDSEYATALHDVLTAMKRIEHGSPLLADVDDPEPQDEVPRDTELIQQVRALVKRYGAPWVAYEAARQARP